MEKTYRDFVNEIITEAKVGVLRDNPNSFGKTFAKNVGAAIKGYKEEKERKLKEMSSILPIYGKAFLIVYNDPKYWNSFIASLKKQSKTGQVTKFQFISYFFKYFLAEVMNNDVRTIIKVLKQASQSLEIQKQQYSKRMVKFVKKFVNNADKHKNIFIKVFKKLTRGW